MVVDIICCETQPLTVLATVRSSGGEPAMSKAGEAWIDVSVTVRHGMAHWPGNPPIVVERSIDIGRGDDCNLSRLAMGVHSGTHNEEVAGGAPARPRPRADEVCSTAGGARRKRLRTQPTSLRRTDDR